jgi:hypothetical protein
MSCCRATDYGEVFDRREARRNAARYRRKGLDGTARRMVGALAERGLSGATVLEVGGGVGAVQIELLRAGASSATGVELSPAYEDAAADLLREARLAERVERRVADFAAEPAVADAADVVVLHRVVCCYPNMPALVGPAADRARRHLAVSFPRDAWWMRLGLRAANLFFALRGRSFRVHLHPPAAILALAEARGLRPVLEHRGWIWQLAVLERRGT